MTGQSIPCFFAVTRSLEVAWRARKTLAPSIGALSRMRLIWLVDELIVLIVTHGTIAASDRQTVEVVLAHVISAMFQSTVLECVCGVLFRFCTKDKATSCFQSRWRKCEPIDPLEPSIRYRLLQCNPPQFIRGLNMLVLLY